MGMYAAKILSELIPDTSNYPLSVHSSLRADIYDWNNEDHKKIIEKNAVIVFSSNDPNNQNYEIGKFFRLDLVQSNGKWMFQKYYGDVSYLYDGSCHILN